MDSFYSFMLKYSKITVCRTTKIIFYVCLLTHFARQDRQNGNLKNKQNHVTKVTKIRKNEVTKMTWDKQKTYNFLGPTELQTFRLEYGLTTSEFRAAKVAKDWSLPIFWDSICSYKKQPVKEKFGIEYWTLPGSNSPWRPCIIQAIFLNLFYFNHLIDLNSHTGYIKVFMQGKCGRNTETTFDIKWVIGTYSNWKNQNPGGRFGATS